MATYKQLKQTHPTFDRESLLDYEALYKGGKHIPPRLNRLLPQNPNEPPEIYEARKREYRYRNYFGPIVNYLAALLFQKIPTLQLKSESSDKADEPPKGFVEWREDCDGEGCDFDTFLHERFVKALVCQTVYFEICLPAQPADVPPPETLAQFREQGLDQVRLRALDPLSVIDWEVDKRGRLLLLIEHTVESRRKGVESTRDEVTECWRVYTPEQTDIYEITYAKKDPPKDDAIVPHKGSIQNTTLGRIPLVEMHLKDELFLGELLSSPQTAHLRLNNALSWALKRTAYPTPVCKVRAEEQRKQMPTLGSGYGLTLATDESFEWVGPPEGPYEILSHEVGVEKDEMYRVTHEMSLGVDNNAAAVGRSGDSKLADAEATKVILLAFAEVVVEVYEKTLELVSKARGDINDSQRWSVEGFKSFNVVPLAALMEVLGNPAVDVPSRTYKLHVLKRLVSQLLPDLDQETSDQIAKELEAGVDEAMEHAALMREQLVVEGPDGEGDDEDGPPKPGQKPKPGAPPKPPKAA